MPQSSDIRIATITGSTAGVTGGELIPPEYEGVIRDISYAEMGTLGGGGPGVTGSRVNVVAQPGGQEIDTKTIGSNQSLVYGESRMPRLGNIPRNNVLQVTTSLGNVVVRVTYSIEYARYV